MPGSLAYAHPFVSFRPSAPRTSLLGTSLPNPSHCRTPRRLRTPIRLSVTPIVPKSTPSQNLNPTAADQPPVLSPAIARTALRSLIQYIRELSRQQPYIARRLLLAFVCIISSKLIGLAVPFYFRNAIDSFMKHAAATDPSVARTSIRAAVVAIILHAISRTAAFLAHEMRNVVFARAGQRIGRSITATSFAHIHSLELAFHTSSRTGALTRIVDRGTRSVMVLFRAIVFSFFPSFFELALVSTVLCTQFSILYVGILFAMFVLFTSWTFVVNDEMSQVRSRLNSIENEASAKLTDSLINIEAVKVFGNSSFETQRYDQSLAGYEAVAIRNESLYARLNMGQSFAYTVGLTAILLLAAHDIANGALSVGSVVLLTTMLQRLWMPLDFLGWQYREVKQSLIDIQNLFDVLGRQSHVQDAPDAKPLFVKDGSIEFKDVTFLYPAGENSLAFSRKSSSSSSSSSAVGNGLAKKGAIEGNGDGSGSRKRVRRRVALDQLSFTVDAGSSVALVGASGSGKSTATRLLCRLYDLSSGTICIDGQDISKATLASLRQAVSIVPQDTALFNDTIEYNIRYGRPGATREEVVEAAKAASIHDVIMRTEQGYDTMVGERGVRLSGGERQRLSVARAFLKGSRVIIEDESTSALDTLTEMEVSKSLQKLGMNRTRIIVAHRLSTIMNVDKVVVLRGGKKVEEGSFDELVEKEGGIFRGMWERQQRKELEQVEEEEERVSNEGSGALLDGEGMDDRDGMDSDIAEMHDASL